MSSRRCICGSSGTFPVCDGSHVGRWSCASPTREVELAVVAAHHLATVGERLAHELGGVALQTVREPIDAGRVILLSDGTDLDQLLGSVERIQGGERIAIAIDGPPTLLAQALPDWSLRVATSEEGLWTSIQQALTAAPVTPPALLSGFISHAVADEALLQPALDTLRRADATVFLCADSIEPGQNWRKRIETELTQAERAIFMVSEASARSTYCAFEMGFVMARGLTPRLISLDGTRPPAFLAHLQAADLPRILQRQPWLTRGEALLQQLTQALT